MPTIRSKADYEYCLLEILRDARGRVSRVQVYRDFERRYYSSVGGEERTGSSHGGTGPPKWQRGLDDAARRLIINRKVYAPDEDSLEIV
ncbi:MAG: hypothetical protein EPO26_17575 [Chloroflexota bacterium]|nr:MAG: hypothetical protein EPO26_17575 [Chloroflexota bacterium]